MMATKPKLRSELWVMLILFTAAASAQAQLLMSDSFDVGNTYGTGPVGWGLIVPSGTQISIVTSAVTAVSSPPFCVQLTDNSKTSRPQMYQNFLSATAGLVTASFQIPGLSSAPAYLDAYTTNGTFLGAIAFDSTGLMGYSTDGTTIVDSAVPWTTGVWQSVTLEWLGDGTFNGYLGTVQFAQRVSLATSAFPSRVLVAVGTNAGTNETAFVDNVQVVSTPPLRSDNFDTGNTLSNSPVNWVITIPLGTNIRVVDQSVQAPLSSPYCVQFSNSSAASPQMYSNFMASAVGRCFFSALVPSTNQAPFYMHVRDTNGNFLAAISLGEDGKMAYNATPGGSGPFTESSLFWVTNTWQAVRVDWFTNGTFNAYLGSNQFAASVPFSTNTLPGRVLFRLAAASESNRLAYLDNVLVNRALYPGTANYTNNGTWLGYAYLGTQAYWTNTAQLAFQMKNNYRVPYWFINVGSLASGGTLEGSVSGVVNFLSKLKTWENQQGYQFKVFAWLNANSATVDVTNSGVVSNMVNECRKLVSTSVPGSYVAGSTRVFDGIQLDLEPAGANAGLFTGLVGFFDQVRAAFSALGVTNKLMSFTSPSFDTAGTSVWDWTPDNYYAMAGHLDLLCAMTYDTGYTSGSTYQNWIRDQTTNILHSVSGKYWNNDAQHPAPTNGVQVMIGFPAFPNSANHTNSAENIFYASAGVTAALTNLQVLGDFSTNYFLGAAVYLQADGTGNDGYASYASDWWMFGQYWLNTWNNFAPAAAITNPLSLFQLLGVAAQGSDVLLTWQTIGGKTNVVQTADGSLPNFDGNFADISTPIVGSGTSAATTNYLDAGALTNFPARYYRIRLVP